PGFSPRGMVEGRGPPSPLQLRADTVLLDTDRATCTVTFRASIPLESREERPRVVITFDARPTGSTVPSSFRKSKPDHLDMTADIPIEFRRIVTPFAEPAAPSRPPAVVIPTAASIV